jgi:hypothetical protein
MSCQGAPSTLPCFHFSQATREIQLVVGGVAVPHGNAAFHRPSGPPEAGGAAFFFFFLLFSKFNHQVIAERGEHMGGGWGECKGVEHFCLLASIGKFLPEALNRTR